MAPNSVLKKMVKPCIVVFEYNEGVSDLLKGSLLFSFLFSRFSCGIEVFSIGVAIGNSK